MHTKRRPRRGNRRRGFFVIAGWRVLSTRERGACAVGKCPKCGDAEAQLIGRVRRAWFTLFFIPILPIDSAGRAQRISQCRSCRTMFDVPLEQLARSARASGGKDFADAIALYNQLRDRPDDGATMLALLETYECMGELSEAESSARHFPRAVAAEPKCAQVLLRMRSGVAAG